MTRNGRRRLLPSPIGPARPSRHPFEVGVMLGLLVTSFSQLMAGPTPMSVNTHMAGQARTLLSACMLVGSAICLIGIVWKEPLSARMLEIAGLCGLAGALGVYSYYYVTTVTTWTSSAGIGITVGLLGASLVRIVQASAWIISIYRRAP